MVINLNYIRTAPIENLVYQFTRSFIEALETEYSAGAVTRAIASVREQSLNPNQRFQISFSAFLTRIETKPTLSGPDQRYFLSLVERNHIPGKEGLKFTSELTAQYGSNFVLRLMDALEENHPEVLKRLDASCQSEGKLLSVEDQATISALAKELSVESATASEGYLSEADSSATE